MVWKGLRCFLQTSQLLLLQGVKAEQQTHLARSLNQRLTTSQNNAELFSSSQVPLHTASFIIILTPSHTHTFLCISCYILLLVYRSKEGEPIN